MAVIVSHRLSIPDEVFGLGRSPAESLLFAGVITFVVKEPRNVNVDSHKEMKLGRWCHLSRWLMFMQDFCNLISKPGPLKAWPSPGPPFLAHLSKFTTRFRWRVATPF